jgi:hypothetical protein
MVIRIIVDPNLVRYRLRALHHLTYILPFADRARWLVEERRLWQSTTATAKYGLKGELIGLDRKMMKALQRAIWLEQDMAGESRAGDAGRHCSAQVLIMLDLLAKEVLGPDMTYTPPPLLPCKPGKQHRFIGRGIHQGLQELPPLRTDQEG